MGLEAASKKAVHYDPYFGLACDDCRTCRPDRISRVSVDAAISRYPRSFCGLGLIPALCGYFFVLFLGFDKRYYFLVFVGKINVGSLEKSDEDGDFDHLLEL